MSSFLSKMPVAAFTTQKELSACTGRPGWHRPGTAAPHPELESGWDSALGACAGAYKVGRSQAALPNSIMTHSQAEATAQGAPGQSWNVHDQRWSPQQREGVDNARR